MSMVVSIGLAVMALLLLLAMRWYAKLLRGWMKEPGGLDGGTIFAATIVYAIFLTDFVISVYGSVYFWDGQ
jgi:multisubunit Na+/H+ antiporter MnhC subunit